MRAAQRLAAVLVMSLISISGCGGVLTPVPAPTATDAAADIRGLVTPTIAPEIYLTPIPPTPTFTPSPSPTPIIHIVTQGDTLFGIALEHGVTVAGLLRVNGLDEADYLRIGQSLIIPVPQHEETDMEAAPIQAGNVLLPTPTPLPLATSGATLYNTPAGGILCLGEVLNTTEGPVTNLQIEVVLLAPDATPLMTVSTLAAADYLAPQDRAPFSVLIRNPPDGAVDSDVRLVRGESISAITQSFAPLTVSEVTGSISGPQYRVRGVLVNEGNQDINRINVVATIYDVEGQVVGYRQLVLGEQVVVAPGEQQPFDLLLTPQIVESPSGFGVIAWGTIR